MNTILVMSDEHSYQMMQFIDRSILKTPALDRLAEESAVFDCCYTPSPLCVPARASFITGQYVHRLGTWDNATPYDGGALGLSQWVSRCGGRYANIGKTHFHPEGDYCFDTVKEPGFLSQPDKGFYFRGEKIGIPGMEKRFEEVGIKTQESFDDRVLEESLQWLEENRNAQNWLLYVGFLDPHFPFRVKKENWDYFDRLIPCVPDRLKPPFSSLNEPLEWLRTYFQCEAVSEEAVRRLLVGYCCAVAELDERLGILLQKIEELGLGDTTAFVYTSDHGEQLGYHGLWWKNNMFEQSAHVPLLLRCPGVAGQRISQPCSLVDLFPTACDLLEIPQPAGLSGQSLLPLAKTGKDENRQDFAFSEYHAHGVPRGMYMIRWQDYKYVYYCGYQPQLFHLGSDPAEEHDLVALHPKAPKTLQVLEACWERLLRICDPYAVDERCQGEQAKNKEEIESRPGQKWVPHPIAVEGRMQ